MDQSFDLVSIIASIGFKYTKLAHSGALCSRHSFYMLVLGQM